MPKISVIVPLYNEEKFIADTIYCLRAQTFKNFECIVVDDCSTDNSVNNAVEAIDGDSRFYIIKNKINSHVAQSRNIGLLHASGEFVVFLDADDILSNTCLTERYTVAVANRYKNIAGSYSWHTSIEESLRKYPSSTKKLQAIISFQSSMGDSVLVMHAPLLRRDVACGTGGFDEHLVAEDYDFWLRILRHGFIFLPTQTQNAYYRIKENSRVRSNCQPHLEHALKIFEASNTAAKNNSFFSIAAMKMHLPAYAYALEEKRTNRILRFTGMLLASGQTIDINKLSKLIPNLYQGFPFSFDHTDLIRCGVLRQKTALEYDALLMKEYDYKIFNCMSEYFKATKNNKKEFNVEDVDVYSAEWQRRIDIVFIPHKDYHTETIKLLQPDLEKKGLSFVVADCSAIYKDEGVRSVLHKSNMPHVSLAQLCLGDFSPKCIVVFNDWDKLVTRPAMEAAKKTGIVSMAIVEGVQDYEDADTGRIRNAYKTCNHVILPCIFDLKYFNTEKQYVYIAGIPRIEKLAKESHSYPYSRYKRIVINSNFSYNVLVKERDAWVKAAVEACVELGIEYVITRHPADLGDFSAYNVTEKTMYDAIWDGSLFISRFGSGLIEAIAMGRPVIYFNPHGEKVDKFKDPMGAYYIAQNKDELKSAITITYNELTSIKKNWPAFLEQHAGYSQHIPDNAIYSVTEALDQALNTIIMPPQEERKKFGEYFAAYFHTDDSKLFKCIKFIDNLNDYITSLQPKVRKIESVRVATQPSCLEVESPSETTLIQHLRNIFSYFFKPNKLNR